MKQLDKRHIFITIKKVFLKDYGKRLLDFSVVLNFITRKVICVGWGTGKCLKVRLGICPWHGVAGTSQIYLCYQSDSLKRPALYIYIFLH